ncbi:hypothetical protein F5H01DRAFT_319711 [Linnemannia elongata]|nr:hypothetical protein F5H01DRAFT_319711 [Linnemannia elongata]
MNQTPTDTPKSTPSFTTTTTTSATGTGTGTGPDDDAANTDTILPSTRSTIVQVLQDEMKRKLDELKDVHNAYTNLSANWNEDIIDVNVRQHRFRVQQAWIRFGSDRIRDYRDDLNDMAADLEDEVSEIRRELAAVLIGGPK